MNTKPPYKMQLPLKLLLLALISNACVTITEKNFYAPKGDITQGCIETHLIGKGYALLDFAHCIDVLQAQDSRPDPDHPGQILPPHGASIIIPADDFSAFKTEHESMCRELGKNCKYMPGDDSTPTPTPAEN